MLNYSVAELRLSINKPATAVSLSSDDICPARSCLGDKGTYRGPWSCVFCSDSMCLMLQSNKKFFEK